jgi:hypothetical protein
MLRLKAIASSLGRRELAMALSRGGRWAHTSQCAVAVPSSARLDCCVELVRRCRRLFLGRPGRHPVFLTSRAEAGRDSALEPIESATRTRVGGAAWELPRTLVTIQRDGIAGHSPASDCIGSEGVVA